MVQKVLVVISCWLIHSSCWSQSKKNTYIVKGDSVSIAASTKYADPSLLKVFFLGNNYRNEWSTPVTLPIFHLNTTGLKIKELGGGQQTKSLRLEDKYGREWALRTIDKDVEMAIPPIVRHTLGQRVTQDMVSGAHPYAPLAVAYLANKAGIVAADPKFYFVPDDTALGKYRHLFANSVCMLEEREPTPDHAGTKNSADLLDDIYTSNQYMIDGKAVLKARLLDMLIADWDRHQDQWRWAVKDSAGAKYYYAIPRDRDQAFFESNGLLVKIARVVALKHLVGFNSNAKKLKKLNAKSWNFDRFFINQLDANDWKSVITDFTASLSDETIANAVKQMPDEMYRIHGKDIEEKLISRRNTLMHGAMNYYMFISQYVTVVGTDKDETYHFTGNKDGLELKIRDKDNKVFYNRTFTPKETQQIRLFALGGNDKFIIDETAKAKIKLNIDGGKGDNQFNIKSRIKYEIYHSDMDAKAFEKEAKVLLRIKS